VRRWELVAGSSAKFWEIGQDGAVVTVRFGRLGAAGQTQTKELSSAEAAQAHVAKLVAEKEKKGYRSVAARPAAAPAEPALASPAEPAVASPATPPAAAPVEPPVTAPVKPLAAAAAEPAVATPATPPATAPAERPTATPTEPAAAPAEPPTATPAEPLAATPVEPPRDEDTWAMPPRWLAQAMPRRDVSPTPEFAVNPALAQEFRDAVAANGAKIAEALAHPDSDPDLVRPLRDLLAGRPDPLGAAVLAALVDLNRAPVHWWIEEFGLPFAAAAAAHYPMVQAANWRDWQTQQMYGWHLKPAMPHYLGDDTFEGQALVLTRTALAATDDTTYDAAVVELEKLGSEWFGQVVRAFLAPTRHDWFEEANAVDHAPHWIVACSASTAEQFGRLRHGALIWSPTGVHTALHVLGPALAPVLDRELRGKAEWVADGRKLALEVLAALPTDEAFLMLLNRVRERYVRPALLAAMAAFPVRAARLLAPRAAGDADARHLLRVHLLAHPGLALPPATAALVAEAAPVTVPDAPATALPRVLAEPPWTHRRPQPKPVVLKDFPVPVPEIAWPDGVREEWLEYSGYWAQRHHNWEALAAEVRSGNCRNHDHRLFTVGPEELALPLLRDWVPTDTWRSDRWGKRIVARFEMDALPAMLRLAVRDPQVSGVILLPYATTEVAELMADWLVRLKKARVFAVQWLAAHGARAVRLLLPAALGAAGPRRRNAEIALRHLHLDLGVDVVQIAAEHGAEPAAAMRTLIDVDPVDVLPAKLPVIGAWADPRFLPQVLLSGRGSALSVEATKALLMMAALSKPDSVYAGLPLAVEACDRESLAEFAWALFGRWQDVDAPSKDGWVLTALGWFGDDETVRRLSPLIRIWPGESQHARAVTGLDVLAQIGSEVALTHLNGIAEKAKFKALKARAQEKVAQIAAELGLTRDQLADRLVPRLGLDDEATSVIDYGPRQFRVGFDEHLKPHVVDPDGKRRKDLPKPGARDDEELAPAEYKRFTALKKDVRTIAADQIHRLERAMVDQRTWTAEEFHTVLAAHPLLWHLVRRLVWITDEGISFRLAEDRTLADAGDDEFTLPGTATVRVAHPVDLADALPAWGEVFADYEILQPFPQLGRPTHAFDPAEHLVPQLAKYAGHDMPVGKVLGLTKHGWVRGEPQDAGVECWITRPLPSGGALVAGLEPGIAVGAVDVFPEVRFTELWFSESGEGNWSAPKSGGPANFEVDPITASELLSELESLRS
jgi:predicted DNA-binding WGR domain protein